MLENYPTIRFFQSRYETYLYDTSGRYQQRQVSSILNRFLDLFPEKRSPLDFYSMDVRDYLLLRKRQSLSTNSLKWELTALRRFFDWIQERLEVPFPNPARTKGLSPGKQRPTYKTPRVLSTGDLARLLSVCRNNLERVILLFCSTTGILPRELRELRWDHFDLERRLLKAPGVRSTQPRELPLREDVVELLRQRRGLPIPFPENHQYLRNKLQEIRERAGYDWVTFYTLRHTFAMNLLASGASRDELTTALGLVSPAGLLIYLTPPEGGSILRHLKDLPLLAEPALPTNHGHNSEEHQTPDASPPEESDCLQPDLAS